MSDVGFWDLVGLVIWLLLAWWLVLAMVRSLGKAWRNER